MPVVKQSQHQRMACFVSDRVLFSVAASLVHTGIVNLSNISSASKSYQDDMEFGNKMAVLSGDFLLANACTGLAELRDTEVVQMISEVIGHLMEGEVMKITFNTDNLNLEFWNELVFKCKGSLMANSCKAALKIVAHSKEVSLYHFIFKQGAKFVFYDAMLFTRINKRGTRS